MEIVTSAVTGLIFQSWLECLAMLLGLAYLALIIRENILAWPCAFFSTAIYTYVFWDAALLMESALNVYYLIMAVYGYTQWQKKRQAVTSEVPITRWPLKNHIFAVSGVLIFSAASGYFLRNHSQAAWPFLDSFTTWGAVLTTYLVAKKIFENWYYWLVIDSVAMFLYIDRELYPTALLMCIYLGLIVAGILRWRKQLQTPTKLAAANE